MSENVAVLGPERGKMKNNKIIYIYLAIKKKNNDNINGPTGRLCFLRIILANE